MKWITENLAVGGDSDGLSEEGLLENGITATLNVAWDLPQPLYKTVLGRKAGLISGPNNSLEAFAEAVSLLLSLLDSHSRVLVYCFTGADRSLTVASAALATLNGWDVKRAQERVKEVSGFSYPSEESEETFSLLLENWGNHKTESAPFVSVVMPCYNQAKTSKRCVESLKSTAWYTNFELIGVNDGSTEQEVAEYLEAVCDEVVSHDSPQGAGAARKAGNAVAQGDLICQIDNDCVFFPSWLQTLVEGFLYHEKRFNARIYGALVSPALEYVAKNPRPLVGKGCIEVDEVGAACMLYRKTLLGEVGDFDPELYNFMEDKDLCKRVKRDTVGRIFIDPRVVVYHGGHVDPVGGFWEVNPEGTRRLFELRDEEKERRAEQLIRERWGNTAAIVS